VEDGAAQLVRHGHGERWPPVPPACGCGGADRRRAARTEHRRTQRHPNGERDPWGRPLDGNVLVANEGANPRELMERMGHDSSRAALIYLHLSTERQCALAKAVGKNARAALGKPKRSGPRVARKRGKPNDRHRDTGRMAAGLGFDTRARQDSNLRPAA
jgi:hypothetical protein